MLEKW